MIVWNHSIIVVSSVMYGTLATPQNNYLVSFWFYVLLFHVSLVNICTKSLGFILYDKYDILIFWNVIWYCYVYIFWIWQVNIWAIAFYIDIHWFSDCFQGDAKFSTQPDFQWQFFVFILQHWFWSKQLPYTRKFCPSSWFIVH